VFLAALPLPFGAVGAGGRLFFEIGSAVLLVLWLVDALAGAPRLPARVALAGCFGLLGFAALQALPLPAALVGAANPRAERLRREIAPPESVLDAERRVLGESAPSRPRTLSLDPQATASALRSGTALAVLILVGASVAAHRGVERLALALLGSAAFQGLYGLLVLLSGHDRIWNTPKLYNLDASTGTFVNANHYACYLALALACGAALVLRNARHSFLAGGGRRGLRSLGRDGARDLLLVLLLACGLGGLLTSHSRAGIVFGLLAVGTTTLALGGGRRRAYLAALLLLASVAAVPLLQLGPESLVESYLASGREMSEAGGRATVWSDTLGIVGAFPATGSGFATFASVYPLFRSGEVRLFYQHAHLDVLQLAAETGFIGLVLAGLLIVPLGLAVVRGLRAAHGPLAPGFAAGLGVVALHSLVDFPFHLPAIAATAAVVSGALLVSPWADPSST
jgi:O-antigen ligase